MVGEGKRRGGGRGGCSLTALWLLGLTRIRAHLTPIVVSEYVSRVYASSSPLLAPNNAQYSPLGPLSSYTAATSRRAHTQTMAREQTGNPSASRENRDMISPSPISPRPLRRGSAITPRYCCPRSNSSTLLHTVHRGDACDASCRSRASCTPRGCAVATGPLETRRITT